MGITNRPDYVIPVIDSIRSAFNVLSVKDPAMAKSITFVIACEPLSESLANTVRTMDDWINTDIVWNPRVLGVRTNPYNAISRAFVKGSLFNIHLEDDLLLSPDALVVFRHHYLANSHSPRNFFTYGAYHSNDALSKKAVNDLDYCKLVESPHFDGLGWATFREVWDDEMCGIWFKDLFPGKSGWDWTFTHYMKTHGRMSRVTAHPFTKHIGFQGTHMRSKTVNDNKFGFILLPPSGSYLSLCS
jgi:hypothetical protein